MMEIEFDAVKDEANRAKHCVSLSEAGGLDWGSLNDASGNGEFNPSESGRVRAVGGSALDL